MQSLIRLLLRRRLIRIFTVCVSFFKIKDLIVKNLGENGEELVLKFYVSEKWRRIGAVILLSLTFCSTFTMSRNWETLALILHSSSRNQSPSLEVKSISRSPAPKNIQHIINIHEENAFFNRCFSLAGNYSHPSKIQDS